MERDSFLWVIRIIIEVAIMVFKKIKVASCFTEAMSVLAVLAREINKN